MPKGYSEVNTLAPNQKELFDQMVNGNIGKAGSIYDNPNYQAGSKYLQDLFDEDSEAYQKFEAPYLRQFREQTVPMLGERFAGFGAGAQSSSAFQQALGSSASELSENLAALRGNTQLSALGENRAYAQQPFENQRSLLDVSSKAYLQKPKSWWQNALSSLSSGAGSGIGGGLGGWLTGKFF